MQIQPFLFPISRDPPEGGTWVGSEIVSIAAQRFPISRDPPEGGTRSTGSGAHFTTRSFQFLGIPPKGELQIGPVPRSLISFGRFPISRDPPEGGTEPSICTTWPTTGRVSFQFLGIPPKGEP